MSKKVARGYRHYRHILLLSSMVMVMSIAYFLYTAQTKWQHLKGITRSQRSSAIRRITKSHALGDQKNTLKTISNILDSKSEKEQFVQIDTGESVNVADDKNMTKHIECPEGKVYFSNGIYDCDGLLKDPNGTKINKTDEQESLKDEKEREILVAPTRVIQKTPKLSSQAGKSKEEDQRKNTPDIKKDEIEKKDKKAKNGPRKMFVNCGGTFPWAVELFLDTYPNSSSYEIFTFLPDTSYKVMYSKLQNHTVIPFEASYQNEITQRIAQIDLAGWLETNTKKSDFVILRIDSKDEIKILKHLNQSRALEYVDKYYTTQGINASEQALGVLMKMLKKFKLDTKVWDNKFQTYSDLYMLNLHHIPSPGKVITLCHQKTDEEKFALFLFSSSASVNALNVINLLHNFSPKDRLQLTIFLPFETFKSGLMNMEKLFATFHVGMYFDEDGMFADDKLQYNLLTNKLTFVRRLFQRYGHVFQYILVGNNTNNRVIASVQKNHHYSFIKGGTDITRLTKKTLEGNTISIDDTGKGSGDFLLVNIDTPYTEYLVLYMVRRFAPWLLNLLECDVTDSGELLNKTAAFFL
ncbi:uncharacterized protein LOC123547336 [Mercenaria mercenaria]|uniref:uncharacterized protein LOC123547336 n=1 Tax=Mercenaria mercenaria TaxID=6596 RepID=UPI00234F5291|nr:uncharacterized protein LOC123547336 [Mercenaria mercenaria]